MPNEATRSNCPWNLAIVLPAGSPPQPRQPLDRELALFRADGNADARDAVVFGGVSGQSCPAAADFEQALARARASLRDGHFELGLFRLLSVVAAIPIVQL